MQVVVNGNVGGGYPAAAATCCDVVSGFKARQKEDFFGIKGKTRVQVSRMRRGIVHSFVVLTKDVATGMG
jgi:hypothetical protein